MLKKSWSSKLIGHLEYNISICCNRPNKILLVQGRWAVWTVNKTIAKGSVFILFLQVTKYKTWQHHIEGKCLVHQTMFFFLNAN